MQRHESARPISLADVTNGWSGDLERGLRANKRVSQLESILRIAPRLQRWGEDISAKLREEHLSNESFEQAGEFRGEGGGGGEGGRGGGGGERVKGDGEGTGGVSDVSLANSVILRLTEAFSSGSNLVRLAVLKAFLQHLEGQVADEQGGSGGLVRSERVLNPSLVVSRLKEVVKGGDGVGRALGLRMVGCLGGLGGMGEGNLELQRMVMEAMMSSSDTEVEAACFAAAMFCAASADFAEAILPTAIDLATDIATSSPVRHRAIWLLSAMWRSATSATSAQQEGEAMLGQLKGSEWTPLVLTALTHLAAKAVVNIQRQLTLLLRHLAPESFPAVHLASLEGLRHLALQTVIVTRVTAAQLAPIVHLATTASAPPGVRSSAIRCLQKFATSSSLLACQLALLPGLLSSLEYSLALTATSHQMPPVRLLVTLIVAAKRLGPSQIEELNVGVEGRAEGCETRGRSTTGRPKEEVSSANVVVGEGDVINDLDCLASRVRGLLGIIVGGIGVGRDEGQEGEPKRKRGVEGVEGSEREGEERYEAADLVRVLVKVWPLLPPSGATKLDQRGIDDKGTDRKALCC